VIGQIVPEIGFIDGQVGPVTSDRLGVWKSPSAIFPPCSYMKVLQYQGSFILVQSGDKRD
jgi:hypothetical protein